MNIAQATTGSEVLCQYLVCVCVCVCVLSERTQAPGRKPRFTTDPKQRSPFHQNIPSFLVSNDSGRVPELICAGQARVSLLPLQLSISNNSRAQLDRGDLDQAGLHILVLYKCMIANST